ncbi:MAG TPA: DUF2914 domain-containing protein [Anaeromyxobacteraceae bacterium]|nr:DUF2914 domain-containing protein [Anaeromyxobacteraceae bacterium]
MKLVIASLLAVPALALAQASQPAAPPKEPARPAAGPARAEATAAAVADAKLGTGVVDREPQGVAESFKSDVGKVYCWTKVTGAEGTEITHAWFKGEEKMGEVKLAVKYPSTRTWSAKTIPADGKGDWRVDVVGADGTVLKSLSFKVD